MEKKEHDNELAKWLNKEISSDELEKASSAQDRLIYEAIDKEVSQWKLPEMDKKAAFDRLKSAMKKEDRPVISLQRKLMYALAASVSIVLVAFVVYQLSFNEPIQQYATSFGETLEITLPDGSEVKLATNSTLQFDKKAWRKRRTLSMTGEAYFKVAKGEKFTVNLEDQSVAVLGTEFNVRKRKGYLNVSCYEGLVQVNLVDEEIKLPAGKSIKAQGESYELFEEKEQGPLWVKGAASRFIEASLEEVISSLEAQYGIELELDAEIEPDTKFSGSFVHSNLETALDMIAAPLDLEVEQYRWS